MKWEVKVITPSKQAKKSCRAFMYQQVAFKHPLKKEFGVDKDKDLAWFKLSYEGNHNQYLRIAAIVSKFNIDMGKIPKGVVFKQGSRKWKPSYKKWAICTFYTNPATLTITEEPVIEDYQQDEKSLIQKIKEKFGKGGKSNETDTL